MSDPVADDTGLADSDDWRPVDWAEVESGPAIVHHLRLKRPDLPMSAFADDSWSLRPMELPEGCNQNLLWLPGLRKRRYDIPSHLVTPCKRIVWLFLNKPAPESLRVRGPSRAWPAPGSIIARFTALRRFVHYLGEQGIERLCDITVDLLDSYATELLTDPTATIKASTPRHLGYLAAIAHFADYLPEADRMVEPAWIATDFVKRSSARAVDNAKAIIDPDTFGPLVWWSRQIVQCAPDIIAGFLWVRESEIHPPMPGRSKAGLDGVAQVVAARGGVLPQGPLDGEVAAQYLIALHGGGIHHGDFSVWRRLRGGEYVVDPALPQPIPVPITCTIEGRPWLPFLDYRDIRDGKLLRVLQAAAAVLICSCTGMRGEECRRLPLGALRTVPRPDGAHSFRIDGRIYKGARDDNDQHDRDGKAWVWGTIKPGADAIAALEDLAEAAGSDQLFAYPKSRHQRELTIDRDRLVSNQAMTKWISELVDYANELTINLALDPSLRISADPNGNVTLDRFRRSVAWHIVNQPEGLLAAGVQFGHMESTTTQGYGSTVSSGIAATMDHERTHALYNTLQDHANAAKTGLKVSGPAAKRLGNAVNRFIGNTFPGTYSDLTSKEERRLRSDPDLIVRENPGHACLCLADPMKPETMACSRENNGEPNRNDCRTYCGSRAYTDATVAADKDEAAQLRDRLDNVNPILAARINKRINHLEAHIAEHETTGVPLLEVMSAEQAKAARAADKNQRQTSVPPDVRISSEEDDQA